MGASQALMDDCQHVSSDDNWVRLLGFMKMQTKLERVNDEFILLHRYNFVNIRTCVLQYARALITDDVKCYKAREIAKDRVLKELAFSDDQKSDWMKRNFKAAEHYHEIAQRYGLSILFLPTDQNLFFNSWYGSLTASLIFRLEYLNRPQWAWFPESLRLFYPDLKHRLTTFKEFAYRVQVNRTLAGSRKIALDTDRSWLQDSPAFLTIASGKDGDPKKPPHSSYQ
jgi:hypothetical protein